MQHVQNSEVNVENKKKHCKPSSLGARDLTTHFFQRRRGGEGLSECVGIAERPTEDLRL